MMNEEKRGAKAMSIAFNTALSGLRALDIKLDVNANNIANVNTNSFKRSRVNMQEAAEGGVKVTIEQVNEPGLLLETDEMTGRAQESSNVSLEEEFVDQMMTRYAFESNVVTIKTADDMQQTLLDIIT